MARDGQPKDGIQSTIHKEGRRAKGRCTEIMVMGALHLLLGDYLFAQIGHDDSLG